MALNDIKDDTLFLTRFQCVSISVICCQLYSDEAPGADVGAIRTL